MQSFNTPPEFMVTSHLAESIVDVISDYSFLLSTSPEESFFIEYANKNAVNELLKANLNGNKLSLLNFFDEEIVNKLHSNLILLHNGKEFSSELTIDFTKNNEKIKVVFSFNNLEDFTDKYLLLGKKQTNQNELYVFSKAKELENLKTSLLANLHHEIRTPIYGILGFSGVLKDDLADAEQKAMVRNIYTSGLRLMSTLQAILDYSQLESDSVSFVLKPVSIFEIMSELFIKYRHLALEKGLQFINPELDNKLFVFGDKQLISNAIANILDNAIKFTDKGLIKTELFIKGEYIEVVISDSGRGIPEEYHEVIFDEFRQVSEGMGRSFEGIGLGLTISKKIIEKLGGSISFTSFPRIGSQFVIQLPFASITVSEENKKSIFRKKRILVVEDNKINSELTSYYLKDFSDNDFAFDGLKALSLCEKNKYDIILMDIDLGIGINGIETMQLIKEKDLNKHSVIIALTGYAGIGDEDRFLQHGFNGFIPKPFNKESLIDKISRILN